MLGSCADLITGIASTASIAVSTAVATTGKRLLYSVTAGTVKRHATAVYAFYFTKLASTITIIPITYKLIFIPRTTAVHSIWGSVVAGTRSTTKVGFCTGGTTFTCCGVLKVIIIVCRYYSPPVININAPNYYPIIE
jgi:hypothetical protein